MGRGRIAGAPTPDIWGRKAGRGRRLQAYGFGAVQLGAQPQTYTAFGAPTRPLYVVGWAPRYTAPKPYARRRRF
eukprot:gene21541-biopygen13202